jgi:hypothetical protein
VRDVIANQDADFPRQNVNPYIIDVCVGGKWAALAESSLRSRS